MDKEVGLQGATLVLDHFHVSKLANTAIDDVRRRVQQDSLWRPRPQTRPLFQVSKLLLADEWLDDAGPARLEAALGDC